MELFSAKEATIPELKTSRDALLVSPLKTADGCVFQFDVDSQQMMTTAMVSMEQDGTYIDWRLLDNTTVNVDYTALKAYYDELLLLNSRRGLEVDGYYMVLKEKPVLLASDIVKWESQVAEDWWL